MAGIVLALSPSAPIFSQTTAEILYWKGLYELEVRGEIREAIRFFSLVLEHAADNREIAALAMLHMGISHRIIAERGPAEKIFRELIEKFPDQRQAVTEAMRHLEPDVGRKDHPLIKSYFDRNPPDPMTAVSHDGRFLAFTDWKTCDLTVKNLVTGETRQAVDTDWPKVREFPYHPSWSRDGRHIAFSWHRGLRQSDLSVVSLEDGFVRTILSLPNGILLPYDWSPDGRAILCEVRTDRFKDHADHFLMSVDLDGTYQKLTSLGKNSRGFHFSPDGRFIAFDRLDGQERHIYILDIATGEESRATSGLSDPVGFNSPTWSEDGKQLLYYSRIRGLYDLWALPFADGHISGESLLIHSNVVDELMRMKRIDEQGVSLPEMPLESRNIPSALLPFEFEEEFQASGLDEAWEVREWTKKNIFGYTSFGRFSLMERPGFLRYSLDPAMTEAGNEPYWPTVSDWLYWNYPALEISRRFRGNRWILESRATFSMVDGVNDRVLRLIVQFDPERNPRTSLQIRASKPTGFLAAYLFVQGTEPSGPGVFLSPRELNGVTDFEVWIRIERSRSELHVEMSDDGENYRTVLTGEIPSGSQQAVQRIVITGNSWFTPAGSYADYDYIRLKVPGEDPGAAGCPERGVSLRGTYSPHPESPE